MDVSNNITPLVLTFNEAPNIGRCLERLRWADRVIVLDSGSTDGTIEIAGGFPNVAVHHRPFDDHTTQWNHGVGLVNSEWVLSLDADYILTDTLTAELRSLEPSNDLAAYFIRFRYCIFGRPLRGSLYPPRAALFRKDRAHYIDDGHTQLLQPSGRTAFLEGMIWHDDRKPVEAWISSQVRYARLEAKKLTSRTRSELSRNDRVRLTGFLGPILVAPYCLFWKRGILGGWRGLYYAFQRLIAELLLALFLIEARHEARLISRKDAKTQRSILNL